MKLIKQFHKIDSSIQQLKISLNTSYHPIHHIQNDVVHFSDQHQNQYLGVIQDQQGKQMIIVSLNDRISTAIQLDKFDQNCSFSQIQKTQLYFRDYSIINRILDFRGNVVDDQQKIENQEQQEYQEIEPNNIRVFYQMDCKQKRTGTSQQLLTGNIQVDYSNPIGQGQFVLLEGQQNTGKSHLVSQMINRHIESADNNHLVIYCQMDRSKAIKMQSMLSQSDHNPYIIISSQTSQYSQQFFSMFSALSLAQHHQQKGKNVLLVVDEVNQHFIREMSLFQSTSLLTSPVSLIKNIHSITGDFQKGAITSVVVYDHNKSDIQFNLETNKFIDEIRSYTDKTIKFEMERQTYSRPKIDFNLSMNIDQFQKRTVQQSRKRLISLLQDVYKTNSEVSFKKQLKIHFDPWEHYLYYDSKYFMDILFIGNYYSQVHAIILINFIVNQQKEELFSYYNIQPQQMLTELTDFLKNYEYLEGITVEKYIEQLLEKDDWELIKDTIERVSGLFHMHLQMQGCLLPYKKDYLV